METPPPARAPAPLGVVRAPAGVARWVSRAPRRGDAPPTPGRPHDTRAPGEPRRAAMPAAVLRLACRAYLAFQLETATPLGREHGGVPSRADTSASLCGVATPLGGGATQDAARIALRLPAFCGLPTREEAAQVLEVSVARPPAIPGPCTSLTQQRRAVLGNPERLKSRTMPPGRPHVQRIARPKNRANPHEIVHMSHAYENPRGPQLACLDAPLRMEHAAPPCLKEMAWTSCIQKPVNSQKPFSTP